MYKFLSDVVPRQKGTLTKCSRDSTIVMSQRFLSGRVRSEPHICHGNISTQLRAMFKELRSLLDKSKLCSWHRQHPLQVQTQPSARTLGYKLAPVTAKRMGAESDGNELSRLTSYQETGGLLLPPVSYFSQAEAAKNR